MINLDRPWIFVDLVKAETASFVLSLRNHGRLPGAITRFYRLEVLITPSDLPTLSYGEPLRLSSLPILSPKQNWELRDFAVQISAVSEAMYGDIKSNRLRYWLYGKVDYTSTTTRQEHETRFSFFYDPSADTMIVGGLPSANHCA